MFKGIKIFLMMFLLIGLAACGTTEEVEEDPTDENIPGEVTEPNDEADMNNGEELAPDDEKDPVSEADEENKLTITGTFVGLADLHTFELTTDEVEEGFIAFQFSDEEMMQTLEDMEAGKEITVTYSKNEHGQHVASKVE